MFSAENKIGITLKRIRKAKGLTQKDVTEYVGISQSNYSKYEIGKVDVNSEYLVRILDRMDITFQEFYFIHNNYNVSSKEEILQSFFNIPFQNLDELIKFKFICNEYLSKNYSDIIQDVITLCEAVLLIHKNNDFKTAREISTPIWNRLSKNDELFIFDIYFLNAILYIFSIEEALNIKEFVMRAYRKYNNFPKIVSVFVNLHINISLLLIENQHFQKALDTLNQVEALCRRKRLYFQLPIILIRKGICLNNLKKNTTSGNLLIEDGKKYLKLFSEHEALKMLESEVSMYNYNN